MADNKEHDTTSSKDGAAWGTLEELLLACAISRHGTKRWDFIAVEVQKRATATSRIATDRKSCYNSFVAAFTPHDCEQRYHALRCRFEVSGGGDRSGNDDSGKSDGENEVSVGRDLPEKLPFMIDELRKLRVEELRREVHRHDVSIVSLKSKVQRLREERGRAEDKADLRTEEDRGSAGEERRGKGLDGSLYESAGKSVSREPSDESENRSLYESESTSQKATQARTKVTGNGGPEPDPVQTEPEFEPDKEFSAEAVGRTSHAVQLGSPGESRASVTESKREVKDLVEVGDVQSLRKRKRRGCRRSDGVGSSGNECAEAFSPANGKMVEKSQPLIKFLEILRSHKHGLVFQRRLPSQETQKYKKLIRQHMDLDTVKSKLDQGVYSNCHPMFYRDLLLIFTNALLFFCKSSTQYLAARDLRRLVADEIASKNPSPRSDPLIPGSHAKNEIPPPAATIVVCRRRSKKLSLIKPTSDNDDGHLLEVVESSVENRKKASSGKDTPMKLKRERWSFRTGTSNRVNVNGGSDEQGRTVSIQNKRMKHDEKGEEEKGKVLDVCRKKVAEEKKTDEGPRTRILGRRSVSTTAKKKPRRVKMS